MSLNEQVEPPCIPKLYYMNHALDIDESMLVLRLAEELAITPTGVVQALWNTSFSDVQVEVFKRVLVELSCPHYWLKKVDVYTNEQFDVQKMDRAMLGSVDADKAMLKTFGVVNPDLDFFLKKCRPLCVRTIAFMWGKYHVVALGVKVPPSHVLRGWHEMLLFDRSGSQLF